MLVSELHVNVLVVLTAGLEIKLKMYAVFIDLNAVAFWLNCMGKVDRIGFAPCMWCLSFFLVVLG